MQQGSLQDEIFKRLDSLAQTLGTTSQYLYGTLAKKGFALGILAVVTAIAFLISFVVMYRTWAAFKYEETPHYDSTATGATVAHIVLGVAISTITLILFIATIANAPDSIYLISPEAYATERVIELLK